MRTPHRRFCLLMYLQRMIEQHYGLETELAVTDFVIDKETAESLHPDPAGTSERLLVHEAEGELNLALYLDDSLQRLLKHAARGRRDWPLSTLLVLLEGVSHFVYVAWKAQNRQGVSELELELQAEVDKFVVCLALQPQLRFATGALRSRLFRQIRYHPQARAQIAERYREANELADKYCRYLETKFLRYDRTSEMNAELRRFYRKGPGKVNAIRAL
ncbi:MAG: hypothetical protein KC609_14850 [Myxococcales bacterium]|nr:hypothetical protein [Myxococcales bacterium]